MRAVVQRVKEASVTVDGETVGSICAGLVVYPVSYTHLDVYKRQYQEMLLQASPEELAAIAQLAYGPENGGDRTSGQLS